jgi:hypothetical protein
MEIDGWRHQSTKDKLAFRSIIQIGKYELKKNIVYSIRLCHTMYTSPHSVLSVSQSTSRKEDSNFYHKNSQGNILEYLYKTPKYHSIYNSISTLVFSVREQLRINFPIRRTIKKRRHLSE